MDEPPLLKSVLRIDVTADRVTIACHAATGCMEDHLREPEDRLVCERRPDDGCRWRGQP